ncbi:MAG: biotin transporter BioY [Bacteroidetes bacterium]|nr:MAG: biotin transporter BioY [Bacteroidota bacterium]
MKSTHLNPTFKNFLLSSAGVIFIAIFAQINIDLPGGIPISGQSFAVLVTAFLLGCAWGTISVGTYVLAGVLGLPFFADGASGFEVLLSGSGGFIIGFIVAAFFTGWLGDKGWKQSFWKSLLAMTIGTAIILFLGISKLTYDYDLASALKWGFYPFIWGAVIKIVIGAGVCYLFQSSKIRS